MREQILAMREQGMAYHEIAAALGCSKSLISYHCAPGQKEKYAARQQELRKDHVITRKVEHFHRRGVHVKTEDFQRREGHGPVGKRNIQFRWRDVIEKFGWNTSCYLTGRPVDLRETRAYEFDHKVPISKGGSNEFDNLGIACREANRAKSDMSLSEFLTLCKEVLEYHGYEVRGGG